MDDKIFEVASWGKYIYRAEMERLNFNLRIQNDDSGIRYFIYSSQWLASLYVVVEGWETLKLSDKKTNELLSVYSDYVLTIKRCRNAVYHFQKNIVDKRVECAVSDKELLVWAGALLDEFIRYLYLYPISLHGVCDESLDLQKEYFDLIGWHPENVHLIKWLETLVYIFRYYEGGHAGILRRSHENDKKINSVLQELMGLEKKSIFSNVVSPVVDMHNKSLKRRDDIKTPAFLSKTQP